MARKGKKRNNNNKKMARKGREKLKEWQEKVKKKCNEIGKTGKKR